MDSGKSTSSYDWFFKHWFFGLFRGCDYSNLHKVASLVQHIRFSTYGVSQNSVSCNFSSASLFLVEEVLPEDISSKISYQMFMKNYCDRVELQPFGLVNLGNRLCGGGELLDIILARGGRYPEVDAKCILCEEASEQGP